MRLSRGHRRHQCTATAVAWVTSLVARGETCCVNTVSRLMRREGIAAETKRKFRVTTDSNHDRPVAENVPDRRFELEAQNRAWTADITYLATGEGWL